jgi:predicted oxidoreductase
MDAVKRGWILKADTIEELVEKIKADPENRDLIDVAKVKETIKNFNEYCAAGKDEEFDRTPSTMGPVEKPPYYAMKLYPGGPNTKGGIDANAKREVLDWEGKPIPRFYTAGEISSVFKFVYQSGGNLTEGIVCGRAAGKNASALSPWS